MQDVICIIWFHVELEKKIYAENIIIPWRIYNYNGLVKCCEILFLQTWEKGGAGRAYVNSFIIICFYKARSLERQFRSPRPRCIFYCDRCTERTDGIPSRLMRTLYKFYLQNTEKLMSPRIFSQGRRLNEHVEILMSSAKTCQNLPKIISDIFSSSRIIYI